MHEQRPVVVIVVFVVVICSLNYTISLTLADPSISTVKSVHQMPELVRMVLVIQLLVDCACNTRVWKTNIICPTPAERFMLLQCSLVTAHFRMWHLILYALKSVRAQGMVTFKL